LKIVKIISSSGKELNNGVFHAELVFPSENRFPLEIRNPFAAPGEREPDQEERLRWYFEEHIASPYTDREKAKRAKTSIAFYGESLFADLFKDPKALLEWHNLVHGLDRIRVQVFSQDRAFQALHWEAMKDPGESLAFCLSGVESTRTSGTVTPDLAVRESECLHLLMVTGLYRSQSPLPGSVENFPGIP
jgi:hypothetical protein